MSNLGRLALWRLTRYAVAYRDRETLLWIARLTRGEVEVFFGQQPFALKETNGS